MEIKESKSCYINILIQDIYDLKSQGYIISHVNITSKLEAILIEESYKRGFPINEEIKTICDVPVKIIPSSSLTFEIVVGRIMI